MSEYALSIEGVTKKFRRFQHPGWRALDALGLRVPKTKYDEFIALHDIDLKVERGEKLALIGRNGAGKSTLLRVISGQMRPDVGSVTLAGNVQALMELGTGFHPDFTGLDNIRSSLAYQGIAPSQVGSLIEEIVEFTELEEFIERPVREYSAGMYARLAFAVATAVTPEVLIIDEILGAGDAYFVGKCIQRMQNLTSQGATVLFVSHDMSSVQLLCERAVWIDHGTIRADGGVLTVSKAYLASVREDEEIRTRARSMALTKAQVSSNTGRSAVAIYRLIGCDGRPPITPAAVAEIRFGNGNGAVETIRPDETDGLSRLIVDRGITNWSNAEALDGRTCRKFGGFGGKFVHAPWQIDWSGIGGKGRWMEIDYKPSSSSPLNLETFDEVQKTYCLLAEIPAMKADAGWKTLHADLDGGECLAETETPAPVIDLQILQPEDRYGHGPLKITAFAFFDQSGARRHTVVSGEPARAVMRYSASEPVIDPVAVIAIYRPDGTCALQVTSNRQGLKLGNIKGHGQIGASFPPLLLGPGDYIVSVALFKDVNIASRHESEAYDLHDRCYALKVLPPSGIGIDIGIVNQAATWEING